MERICKTKKFREKGAEIPPNKGALELFIKEVEDTDDGVRGFIIMEDRSLMGMWMHPYTERLLIGGLGVVVCILLWGYLCLEEKVWEYVWAFGCYTVLFLMYALCQTWIQRASWKNLDVQKMLIKGVCNYLYKQGPVDVIYQVKPNNNKTWMFKDLKRSFLYVSRDWVYLIRLLKFEKPIFRSGGWYVLAEPRQRVIHLVDFCQIPETLQPEAYCLQRFVEFLRLKRGRKIKSLRWDRMGESIQVLSESPEDQEGYHCIWAKGPDQIDWLFITDDEHWQFFVKLWNRLF